MTDYSHNISSSILSSAESVASTTPKTGLRRLLTQLLIIIYIFVGIAVIIAYSTHICKQATKITIKETLQNSFPIEFNHIKIKNSIQEYTSSLPFLTWEQCVLSCCSCICSFPQKHLMAEIIPFLKPL